MFRGYISLLAVYGLLFVPLFAADSGIETGVGDDFIVKGVEGTALDPDVEIKGFTVFGATQAAYAGGTPGPGNMVVNGVLAVSSGIYSAGVSTFAARLTVQAAGSAASDMAQLWRNSGGVIQASMSATGVMMAVRFIGDGSKLTNLPGGGGSADNLGNHVATTTLNMNTYAITGVLSLTMSSDRRMKKDIEPIGGSEALGKIMRLRPVSFRWRRDNVSDLGLIAQDLRKVFPELVAAVPDGGLSVRPTSLISPIIAAMQEMELKNKRLEERLSRLEKMQAGDPAGTTLK